jgi:hypothetical protein
LQDGFVHDRIASNQRYDDKTTVFLKEKTNGGTSDSQFQCRTCCIALAGSGRNTG